MKTNKKYFNARKECPLCENSNSEIFYEENFLSTNVLDFLSGYYKNRVPIEVLEGTDFNIHYCKKCDFYWHGNILNESMLEELYSIWISPEESKEKYIKSENTRDRFRIIVKLMHFLSLLNNEPLSRINFLDYGGGWGQWAICAKSLSCNSFICDLSQQRKTGGDLDGIQWINQSDFEIYKGKFDIVVMNQVLEHLIRPLDVLKNISSLLKIGGIITVSVPYAKKTTTILTKGAFQPLEHINGFTPNSLKKILEEAGFEIVRDTIFFSDINLKSIFKSKARNFLMRTMPKKYLPIKTSIICRKKR